jgi:formylglycine-generating enzyme required for sulfatase activity
MWPLHSWCVRLLLAVLLFAGCAWPAGLVTHAAPGYAPGGAAYPDLMRAGPKPRGGTYDAALVITIEDYAQLRDRPGAGAIGAAWYRYFRADREVEPQRITLLRDAEATPRAIDRAIERTRKRVGGGGTLWIVFVGHIASSKPGSYGELWLADAARPIYAIDSVLGRVAYGKHPRAVVVLDGCMASGRLGPATGVSGTATPGMPRLRIRNNVFTRSLLRRNWEGPPRSRREPVDVAIYSAGLGPGCVEHLPGVNFPALSYLILGGLRGWADIDGNGNISTVELLRQLVRTLRAVSPAPKQAQPSLYGADFPVARRVGEPGPSLAGLRAASDPPISAGELDAAPLRWTTDSMVMFARGSFYMGCPQRGDPDCERDEKPAFRVQLSRFAIDRLEVTQGEYQQCVAAGGCTPLDLQHCFVWNGRSFVRGGKPPGELLQPDHPVVCVDWLQAATYCNQVGKRLPTEAEWERAAAGSEQRRYPWGNEPPTCARAQFDGCWDHTRPVAIRPTGATPEGVHDLAGNASEWVLDWYSKFAYARPFRSDPAGPDAGQVRVVRGGSYYDGPSVLRAAYRYGLNPNSSFSTVGFRCVR